MKLAHLVTSSGITVFVKGQPPFTMPKDHKLFEQLKKAAQASDLDEVTSLIHAANKIETFTSGKVAIVDGEVTYEGEVVHNTLAETILGLIEEDENPQILIHFLENLMLNPSYHSREQLYGFLEKCDHPITDDGRFIAYKWVRNDYKDAHSGTFDNSVGQIIKMDRSKVDDNPNRTCSAGLHVCSKGYGKFSDRLLAVAVNPRDVVSVPTDYNNSKMRVSEYEVIAELPVEAFEEGFKSSVYRVAG